MTSQAQAIQPTTVPDDRIDALTATRMVSYLFGSRRAILAAAQDRSTLWIGLLLVFAASLAREYDGVDLRREPWRLLVPLGASVAISLLMWVIVRRPSNAVDRSRSFWGEFRRFLGLFWLTAPLALLYGIPYERMLDPVAAMRANLLTLALVAAWRVALMTRVVSIFTSRPLWASFWMVMFAADLVAIPALALAPRPVLQVMGGVQLSSSEALLQSVGFNVTVLSIITFPVWAIGAFVAGHWWVQPKPVFRDNGGFRIDVAMVVMICLLPWVVALPLTQREQRLASQTGDILHEGRLNDGLALMSQHSRTDYPPAWDPPPRLGWAESQEPDVLQVLRVIRERGAAEWVRAIYVDKLEREYLAGTAFWLRDRLPEVIEVLDSLPEAPALNKKYAAFLKDVRQTIASEGQPAATPTTLGGTP